MADPVTLRKSVGGSTVRGGDTLRGVPAAPTVITGWMRDAGQQQPEPVPAEVVAY